MVDDHEVLRSGLRWLLTRVGWVAACAVAANGEHDARGVAVLGDVRRRPASQVRANTAAFAPLGTGPLTLLTYAAPVSNDAVTIGFRQNVAANDALRTGSYSKTLTFTLSTTTP